ncbi:hypothetical protein [Streptacidiphilus pinicola]|uniref:hypothetical protein n=1 Tax=Streptacidiphilus pinicola TaxID=2219663 RepID=UPI001A9ED0BF|nr:hypothetical protein [Streptacidiphilus pinicola]
MNRKLLSLAATTVLTAAAGALGASPAQAAGGTLTVTTISRTGAKVTSNVVLTNPRTGDRVTAKSGKPVRLATGSWSLVVDIETPDNSVYRMSDTLAATQVAVSGNTAVTLDARRGRPVTASVDATSGKAASSYGSEETAVACPVNDIGGEVGVYNIPGKVYEIPNPRATQFRFAWMQTWASDMASGPGQPSSNGFYAVTRVTSGLPAAPNAAFRQAGMAEVSLAMRNGETSQPINSVLAQPAPAGGSCDSQLYGYADMLGNGVTGNAYLSPGQWSLQGYNDTGAQGLDTSATTGNLNLTGGRHIWQTFGRAAWGPAAGLPYVTGRAVTFTPYKMIADTDAGTSGSADTRDVVTLSQGGRVLKRQTLKASYGAPTFSQRIGAAGWYDLAVSATRVLPAQLTTGVTLDWHFHADPAVSEVAPGYLATLNPWGLSLGNSAAPGSTTPVSISLHRVNEPWPDGQQHFAPESVKELRVYASHDGGKTWHYVKATWSGGQWLAEVPEPATAGAVALRTYVVDTAGGTSTQTVYGAFLVG